jgi:hypothetical protein
MKAYLYTTCALFGLLVVAHIWRVTVEPHLLRDPWFIFFTMIAAGFCIWAIRLIRVKKQDS